MFDGDSFVSLLWNYYICSTSSRGFLSFLESLDHFHLSLVFGGKS